VEAPLEVVEPPAPGWVRRPADLVRALLTLLAVAAVLMLARYAAQTSAGIGEDLDTATRRLPALIVAAAALAVFLGGLALPIWLGVDQWLRHRRREYVHALVAAAVAVAASLAMDAWLRTLDPENPASALLGSGKSGLPGLLAGLVALFAVVTLDGRPLLRLALWGTVGFAVVIDIISGTASLAVLLALLIGRFVGLFARWAFGTPNLRPDGERVGAELRALGMDVRRLELLDSEGGRHYVATTPQRSYDAYVIDRDQQGSGLISRTWRSLRVQDAVQRRLPLSLRGVVDHVALMAMTFERLGIAAPRLLAVGEVGPDAAVLVLEGLDGVPLTELEEIDDARLADVWATLKRMHAAHVSHGGLTGHALVAVPSGIGLRDLNTGEIAAGELRRRIDVAEALATLAVLVGPERSVRSAVAALGTEATARTFPLLQPIAFSTGTRAALRGHDVLPALRDLVEALAPQTAMEQAPIERLRPRTLVTVIAGALGGYFLLSQLGSVDLVSIITEAEWNWALVALAFSSTTYVGAAMALAGFVPETLSKARNLLAQVAGDFVSLVAPPAFGSVALNARFVQRQGIEPALAVASVGLAQVSAFIVHTTLLIVVGIVTGTSAGVELIPSTTLLLVVGLILALAASTFLIPAVRRAAMERVRPVFARILPRLFEVLQTPSKLAVGMGGNLLLNLAYIAALAASIRAFGAELPIAAVALVYLAGATLGSASPTPGGLGAVEAALVAGLTAAGLDGGTAVSATLLFRVVTFWFPVLPGYFAFGYMQRKQMI
jgi:glycosyltransferase 2 family protein